MVYIQSDSERKLPHHFDAASALYGAKDTAQDYRLTSFEEVQSGKFDNLIRTNLFVGSVEFMREVFSRVGKTPAPILNSNRTHLPLTMKQVREAVANDDKIFVKPFQQKLFSGLVVDKFSISSLKEFADDLVVMAYEPLPTILSEWRVYVMYNKIEDSRNYSGDFKIAPQPWEYIWILGVIKKLGNQLLSSSFVVDVGVCKLPAYVTQENTCEIIEFNDMYAIGNYGVDNSMYLRMLKERYFEIMRHE